MGVIHEVIKAFQSYYLVMLKDNETNDDGTSTTYFRIIEDDKYSEAGYSASTWMIDYDEDDIIDTLKEELNLNIIIDDDGWACGNLLPKERKKISKWMNQ